MPYSRRAVARLLLPIAASTLAVRVPAQCRQWDPTLAGSSSANAPVLAIGAIDLGAGASLYAAGTFTTIGGAAVDGVAKRSGPTWVAVGQGLGVTPFAGVRALAVFDDGSGPELFAGGSFQPPPPGPDNVARFDGSSWVALGASLTDPSSAASVDVLLPVDDGGTHRLFAGGTFTMSGTTVVNHVAEWSAGSWRALGTGTDGAVRALAWHDDGTGPALYVGGAFATAGGVAANGIARWNGVAWSDVGGGVHGDVRTLVVHGDDGGVALYAGGAFDLAGGVAVNHLARWDGTAWSSLAGGVAHPTAPPSVEALASFDDGDGPGLFAGGVFTSAGGVQASRVARWDGTGWSPLGSGTDASVTGFAVFDDGSEGGADLYAIGNFTTAGGVPSRPIAEWRGCSAGATFCASVPSPTTCPCANAGRHGHGCDNSQATGGAVLRGTRSTDLDSVVLTSLGEPPAAFSVFFQSALAISPAAYGDGLGCLAGTPRKLYAKHASAGVVSAPEGGDLPIRARSAALGDPLSTGSTRFYQVVYRDPNPQFCPAPQGSTFNASNGLVLVW